MNLTLLHDTIPLMQILIVRKVISNQRPFDGWKILLHIVIIIIIIIIIIRTPKRNFQS